MAAMLEARTGECFSIPDRSRREVAQWTRSATVVPHFGGAMVARVTRRRLLLAVGSGTALLSLPAGENTAADRTEAGDRGWTAGPALSVVAHPDDDLYFLNPTVSLAIGHGGAEVVSVVVTAAEGDGRNVDTGAPDRDRTPVDYAGYSAARHHGLRRAYARMAGLPADSTWTATRITLPGGLTAEHHTRAAAPRVQLYLLNVAHTYDRHGTARNSMVPLWNGTLPTAPTLTQPVQQVSRAGLIEALTELIRRHRPAVIRTLDPDPEQDWGKPGYVPSDHLDHTATARFTLAAAERSGAEVIVEHYRGYANRFWPANLSHDVVAEKASYVRTYAGADGCADPGCGDRQLGTDPYRSTHILSTAERYRPSTSWLVRAADDTMVAVVALAGRATVRTESRPGVWSPPDRLDGGWILPAPVLAAGPDGRTHLVCLRRTEQAGGAVRVEVVHAVRRTGAFTGWTSLGGPDTATDPRGQREVGVPAATDSRAQREVGVPAATVDGTGRLWVFVRDHRGALAMRRETPDGGWTPWTRLGGELVQDAPAALTTAAGLVEVVVPGKRLIHRWRQLAPGTGLTADHPEPQSPVATGGLTATETSGGRACLHYRQPRTAKILAIQEDAGRPGSPYTLGGPDGTGPVAAAGRSDAGATELVLACRDAHYTTTLARPARDDRKHPAWHRVGGPIVGAPALAADRDGRLLLAVLGQDGRVHIKRQVAPRPDAGFGPWTTL
jgi:LmbE family N-acetylglucosaminyl deacetylase